MPLGRIFRWFVGVSRFFSYIYKAIILFLGGKKGYSEPSKFLYMVRDKYSRLVNTRCSSVGRMRALGACGRRFESCHLDYKSRIRISVVCLASNQERKVRFLYSAHMDL